MARYSILKIYYNKHGVNDGVNYQVVNERLQTVSNHRTARAAETMVRKLNKIKRK